MFDDHDTPNNYHRMQSVRASESASEWVMNE